MQELDWEEVADDDQHYAEVNAAEEETIVPMTLDSGTVEHVIGPSHLPAATPIEQAAPGQKARNFVGASGSSITSH